MMTDLVLWYLEAAEKEAIMTGESQGIFVTELGEYTIRPVTEENRRDALEIVTFNNPNRFRRKDARTYS